MGVAIGASAGAALLLLLLQLLCGIQHILCRLQLTARRGGDSGQAVQGIAQSLAGAGEHGGHRGCAARCLALGL